MERYSDYTSRSTASGNSSADSLTNSLSTHFDQTDKTPSQTNTISAFNIDAVNDGNGDIVNCF